MDDSPPKLQVVTYTLSWPDGCCVCVKVLAEGDRGAVLTIDGSRERVGSIKVYKTARAIEEELRFIAAQQRAAFRRVVDKE